MYPNGVDRRVDRQGERRRLESEALRMREVRRRARERADARSNSLRSDTLVSSACRCRPRAHTSRKSRSSSSHGRPATGLPRGRSDQGIVAGPWRRCEAVNGRTSGGHVSDERARRPGRGTRACSAIGRIARSLFEVGADEGDGDAGGDSSERADCCPDEVRTPLLLPKPAARFLELPRRRVPG
jgi:hypothetical protein